MTKYHINKKGVPAPCRAKEGNCPLGGDETHFNNIEEAQKFADEANATSFGLLGSVNGRSPETVEDFDAKLEKRLFSSKVNDRMYVARRGYGAEILATDSSERVRKLLAEKGFAIEELVNDPSDDVRAMNAYHNGSRLSDDAINTLTKDESHSVRRVIAKQGFNLDKLMNDERTEVRGEVAEHGHGLETLINDKEPWVRERVAMQGYGLDKLVNDENSNVRVEVAMQNYGLDKLAHDKDPKVRRMVAIKGHDLLRLQHDEDEGVRQAVEYAMMPELYTDSPKRKHSYSLNRKYSSSVKGIKPVDYKEYAKENNLTISEAARDVFQKNLDIVSGEPDGNTWSSTLSVEFDDDGKPSIYNIYKDGREKEKHKSNKKGVVTEKGLKTGRINRLITQYYEALETK